MLEVLAEDLRVGDEYTTDQGETWWKVVSNSLENRNEVRIYASCVYSQVAGIKVSDEESGVYDNAAETIVR